MRLSYLSGEEQVWGWVESLAHKVPFYPENGRMRATWSLGQNLYTPEDETAVENKAIDADNEKAAAQMKARVRVEAGGAV